MLTFNRSLTAAASVAGACLLSASALAAAPIVDIHAPTSASIVYSSTFPFVQDVTFSLQATSKKQGQVEVDASLKDIGVLNVLIDDASILAGGVPVGNPFDSSNACTSALTTLPNTCLASDSDNAVVSVPWTVTAVGQYTITVSAKIHNAEGEDEEVVMVALASAEYPAPPAVANAYIKANPSVLLSKKQHGCVISKIADEHAKYEAFGPKGGPYDNSLIHAHVVANSAASTCPLK